MSKKDYEILATVMGEALAASWLRGGEDARTHTYNEVYSPLTVALLKDNPKFDTLRFGGFTSAIETAKLAKAKALSAEIRSEWVGQGDDPSYEQEATDNPFPSRNEGPDARAHRNAADKAWLREQGIS